MSGGIQERPVKGDKPNSRSLRHVVCLGVNGESPVYWLDEAHRRADHDHSQGECNDDLGYGHRRDEAPHTASVASLESGQPNDPWVVGLKCCGCADTFGHRDVHHDDLQH